MDVKLLIPNLNPLRTVIIDNTVRLSSYEFYVKIFFLLEITFYSETNF